MTEIRIERKRRPWWLLILILLIAVAVGAWLYYNETVTQGSPQASPSAVGETSTPLDPTLLTAA